MGLDVYLSKIENFERVKAKEEEYRKICEEIWKRMFGETEYNEVPEEDINKYSAELEKIKTAMELSKYGTDASRENVCINSSKYPDHTFKIGYFRSSYNGSGFDSIVGQAIGMTIYHVFDPPNEVYEAVPDWIESKIRAQHMIDELKRIQKEAPYSTECLDHYNHANQPNSGREALDMFLKEIKSHDNDPFGGSYSNQIGRFSLKEPLEIFGFIHGKSMYLKNDCTYIIVKNDYSYYIQAAEIMLETIEYVLSQDHPEWYILSWSG